MAKKPAALAYDVQGGLGLDFVARGPATTDRAKMTATCIFSTDAVDRVGDRIHIPGIRTANHQLNPVVFWDHAKNLTLPIGRTMDDFGAYTVVLSETEASQTTHFSQSLLEAEQIFWLIDEKIVGANSIGFKPIKASPLYVGGRRAGLDLHETELLEISWVGVGCNQEAVRAALAREHICGKSLAEPLRRSLEPWASARPIWSNGADLYACKSLDDSAGQSAIGEDAQRLDVMADILGHVIAAKVYRRRIKLKAIVKRMSAIPVPRLQKIRNAMQAPSPLLKTKAIDGLVKFFVSEIGKRSSVDPEQVVAALKPFANVALDQNAARFAKADYLAIKRLYGPLAVQRIKAIANDTLRSMRDVPSGSAERGTLKQKLGICSWMLGQAKRDGIEVAGRKSIKSAEFEESKHPRGQPGNAGQFGSGGGGGAAPKEEGGDKPAGDRASKIASYAAKLKEQHGDAAVGKLHDMIAKLKESGDPQAASKIGALKEAVEHLEKKPDAEPAKKEGEPEADAPKQVATKERRQEHYANTARGAAEKDREKDDAELAATREKEDAEHEAKKEAVEERQVKEIEELDSKIEEIQTKRDDLSSEREDEDVNLSTSREEEDDKVQIGRDKEDYDITNARAVEDAKLEASRKKVRDKLEDDWHDTDDDTPEDAAARKAIDDAEAAWSDEDDALYGDREKEDEKLQVTRDKEDEKRETKREKEDAKIEAAREKEDAKLDAAEAKLDEKKSKLEDKHADELADIDQEAEDREGARSDEDDEIQTARDEEDAFFDDEEGKEVDKATALIDSFVEGDEDVSHDDQLAAVHNYNRDAAKAGERTRIGWFESSIPDNNGWTSYDVDSMSDTDFEKWHPAKSFAASKKDMSNWDEGQHPRGQPGNAGQFGSGGGGGKKPVATASKPSEGASDGSPSKSWAQFSGDPGARV